MNKTYSIKVGTLLLWFISCNIVGVILSHVNILDTGKFGYEILIFFFFMSILPTPFILIFGVKQNQWEYS